MAKVQYQIKLPGVKSCRFNAGIWDYFTGRFKTTENQGLTVNGDLIPKNDRELK